ncbi:unnamed protein product, partial [Mesorhabditis spiculigera]
MFPASFLHPATPSSSSIFPQPNLHQLINFCYQQQALNLAMQSLKRFNSVHTPEKDEVPAAKKPKFDFARLATTIENEVKVKTDALASPIESTTSPQLTIPTAPFQRPWFMLPGKRTGGRTTRPKKEFICKYCHRQFTKSYNLLIHERTHTDERPYPANNAEKLSADRTISGIIVSSTRKISRSNVRSVGRAFANRVRWPSIDLVILKKHSNELSNANSHHLRLTCPLNLNRT